MGGRFWRRKDRRDSPAEAWGLAEECEAFLSGTYLEHLFRAGEPIPSWAWLNPLAHCELDELVALARRWAPEDAPVGSWSAAVFRLAGEVLAMVGGDAVALRRLQQQVLLPLELDLMAHGPAGPAEMVRLVLGVLT